MDIRAKRVFDPVEPDDGVRILVDRVWPRGMTKAQVRADLWWKEIAPSSVLRRWLAHDLSRWARFRERYFAELDANPAALQRLRDEAGNRRVTLLFLARDPEHNQAVALQEYLRVRSP